MCKPPAARPQVYSAPHSDSDRKQQCAPPFAPGQLALYSDAGAEPAPPRTLCPSRMPRIFLELAASVQVCYSRACASPAAGCCGGGTSRETTNQDRAVAAWPTREGDAFLGVFDGHGVDGHLVASFVSERLAELLLHSFGDLSQQIGEANDQLCASAVPSEWSGTTAIVALLGADRVRVACVGDSRCVLGSSTPLPAAPASAQPATGGNGWLGRGGRGWLGRGGRGWRGWCSGERGAWTAADLSQGQTCLLPSERERIGK